eukprot:Mrub_14232.p1 GENE.Mrub_14232~~Mrub_14232.p1  ORF type:complete len:100 (-),score=7.03 Mrub_14232:159-419(-)
MEQFTDMSNPEMVNWARERYLEGVNQHNLSTESEMANYVKKAFDKRYGPNWNCIVGKAYQFWISYEESTFLFFYHGQNAILLWKIG